MVLTKKEILANLGCGHDKWITPPDKNKIELAKLDVLIDIRDELTKMNGLSQFRSSLRKWGI